jgi:hypothetical protein
MNAQQTIEMNKIEEDFAQGNLTALRQRRCPMCGGKLSFSLYRGHRFSAGPWTGRYECGGRIYCVGDCNTMLSLWDGVCPEWAEDIKDWEAFSKELYAE